VGALIVMLREGFEASLVVGIVLAFLNRAGRRDAFRPVWIGAGAAAAVSVGLGATLFAIGAELEGKAEAAWEGATMLLAAALLTWMIFWMRRHARTLRHTIESEVERALVQGSWFGLAAVVFVGVLREGVETALFLFGSFEGANKLTSSIGAAIGLACAAALGYLFYRGSDRLDVRRFFTLTSGLLLVFAAYLLAGALHAFGEAGIIPESGLLLVGVFVAAAAPTLYVFFRRPRPAPVPVR
jgi:high-affinity iron transporter